VDFAPPLGYVEPSNPKEFQPRSSTTSIREHTFEDEKMGFKAFAGQGVRLSGKAKNDSYNSAKEEVKEGIPEALRLPPGKFFFGYKIKPLKTAESEDTSGFQGKGTSLREARLKT
jgi:ubiquitin fusion degradation protein 1